jgi:hypothetical protein
MAGRDKVRHEMGKGPELSVEVDGGEREFKTGKAERELDLLAVK